MEQDVMRQPDVPPSRVKGWGADLERANRPAVPKEKPSDVKTVRGKIPERQIPHVKIHQSVEHPDLTPVFGTACPPRGVSGRLRDLAYVFSEGRLAHWMTLMLADRVDVLEGRLEDLRAGRMPHPIRERGLKSELRYGTTERKRRNALLLATGLGVVAVALLIRARSEA
jgi:hypothetical protein